MAGRKKKGDAELVLALACGATPENAAQKAGLSVRTVYRRLAEPAFRAQVRDMRTEMVRRMAGMLTAAGVPVAKVLTPEELATCAQIEAREFIEVEDHPVSGRRRIAGLPFRLSSQPGGWIRSPAPLLGQHNTEILEELLGLDHDEIAKLHADGVIGTRPVGS